MFVSDDYCKNFKPKQIDDFFFQRNPAAGGYMNACSMPNIQKNNDNFIISNGYNIYRDTVTNNIVTINIDLIKTDEFLTRGMVIDYVNFKGHKYLFNS